MRLSKHHQKEEAAGVMSVTRDGKSNPFDGIKYTRVCADRQGFAATAIIPFDTGDGDAEWHACTA
jgi:hypothetical protein